MTEHPGAVTFKGKPLTLVGEQVAVGSPAPDFTAAGNDLSEVSLADYRGKAVLISSVPSLDTPVCDQQTRRFNEEAGKLGDDVVVLTVSMDLPFAQKRWCGAAGIENVVTVSDYKDHAFADAYGLYLKELGLLARSVTVVDRQGEIVYHQLVKEVTDHPDYDKALAAIKAVL
jgi:thiol peroxidase